MSNRALDFIASALTETNPFMGTREFIDWLAAQRSAHRSRIEPIEFSDLTDWGFDEKTGNLQHLSGKFFSIEGIRVRTNAGGVGHWSQPIINQPEIGILGILAKKFNGILYFLVQAKMEPGNIGRLQIAPTLQATRSNYTQVHGGTQTPYLSYFLNAHVSTILVDSLQSEQGGRFLRKRNRNIIVEVTEDVPVEDDFCWLTLGQIQRLCQYDNLVNMDSRSVLSCIPYAGPATRNLNWPEVLQSLEKSGREMPRLAATSMNSFRQGVVSSLLDTRRPLHDLDWLISWYTSLKIRYELEVSRIPLGEVEHWCKTPDRIHHKDHKYFEIIAVSVLADNREVRFWTQPLINPLEEGIVAFIVKRINGLPHFLIQAKVEPGNFDIIEMAPSVQCITGNYINEKPSDRPCYLDYVLNASKDQIIWETMQSEEGGRFFREENKNMLIEVGDDFPVEVSQNYTWMTLNQIKRFIRYNNYVNVQTRSLLACIGFI